MRTGTIQVSGGTLETGWWGSGPADAPTLVMLHEGLGSVALWRDVPERLAATTGWGVFAYSRFGYGNSDTTSLPRPMSYMHHEAQVVLPELLRSAGIARAVLVGHSDGGSIAAIYAGSADISAAPLSSWPGSSGQASTRVKTSLVARTGTGALAGPDKPDHDDQDKACRPSHTNSGTTSPVIQLLGLVTIAAHFIVEDLNIVSIRQIKAEYDAGALRQRLARYHRDVDIAFRGWNDAWLDPHFRDFDITGLLPNIQVPILALQGTNDPYGTDEQLRVLEANVRAPIKIQLIPHARHSPHLEARDVTLAAITDFIANLPRDFTT